MSDKELLEQAAKAAGLRLEWQRDILRASDDGCVWDIWNPLNDDGDALRLAVKLGGGDPIRIEMGRAACTVEFDNSPASALEDTDGQGPNAAIRRAIVRAAAALVQKTDP